MVLDHGISTDVLIPSIESMVLCYYGFGPWYCEGPKTIKGGRRSCGKASFLNQIEYLTSVRSGILMIGLWCRSRSE